MFIILITLWLETPHPQSTTILSLEADRIANEPLKMLAVASGAGVGAMILIPLCCFLNTAERSDRSFLVAFQNYKFNCATENSKLLLSVFVTESVVMAGILNTTFVHSTHSAT